VEAHLLEWLNLSVRWVHMITGVAWIGASFYFVWLENNLNRVNPKNGLAGDLWAIHGGGIYHLEKYKLAPPTMPDNLHWFKWEAYFTWMSGVALLCVVFYLNPTLYLLAPGSSLSGTEGVLLGIGSLFAGWFIYSFLCDSALGKRPALLGLILFVLLIAAAYGFSKVFSGRGAYLHVGAVIGTIWWVTCSASSCRPSARWWRPSPRTAHPTRRCRPRACCVHATTTTSPCRCCSS